MGRLSEDYGIAWEDIVSTMNMEIYTGPEEFHTYLPSKEEVLARIGTYPGNVYRVGYSDAGRAEYTVTIRELISELTAKDIKFFYNDGYAVKFPWATGSIYPFYITVETYDGKTYSGHPDVVAQTLMDTYHSASEHQSILKIQGDFDGAGDIWEPRVYDASFKLSTLHEGHFKVYVLPRGDINNDGSVDEGDTEAQMTLLTNGPESEDVPCDVSRDCNTNAKDLLALLQENANATAQSSSLRMMKNNDISNVTSAPAIKIGNAETKSGGIAEVPIMVSSSQSLGAVGLSLDYDHTKMKLTEVEFGESFVTGSCKANVDSGRLVWADAAGMTSAKDELFATLQFIVDPNVSAKEELAVSATYDVTGDYVDKNGDVMLPEISEGTVTVTEKTDEPSPIFKTHSLVLSGQIGVNFFIDLPEIEGVDYTESYVEFTISGKDGATTIAKYDPTFKNTTGEYYGFRCYVNSIQMAETITAVFHYGENQTVTDAYSVKEYMAVFDENRDKLDATTIGVFEAMADYGHYVQPFLSQYRGWTIGEDYAEMDKYYHTYEAEDLQTAKAAVEEYASVREKSKDIEEISFTLSMDSGTDIFVYFKPVEGYTGDFSVTVDGQASTAALQSDGRYKLVIPGISAHKLGTTYNVIVTTESGESTVKVSAMSYVKSMLDYYIGNSSQDIAGQNAAVALYYYYKTANDYKLAH